MPAWCCLARVWRCVTASRSSTRPGLIDAGYRGELRVLLLNTDRDEAFAVAAGDRIAQLVIVAVALPEVAEVGSLTESSRGTGGFGSSGQ